MKLVDFLKAIEIITKNHSNEIVINKVTNDTGDVRRTGNEVEPTLRIKNCTTAVVNNLHDAGFSLSMDNGFMLVNKF